MLPVLHTPLSIRWCKPPAYTWLKARIVIAKEHRV